VLLRTSRREDALDTVIALRRPEDYSPEEGARFEIHFEKLRNRVDGNAAVPFEARIESGNGGDGIRWLSADLMPPRLKQAASLFSDGRPVRQVAGLLACAPLMPGCVWPARKFKSRTVLCLIEPRADCFHRDRGGDRYDRPGAWRQL
jgi:hypothetical protein